jgi:hypothetical protein
MGTPLQIRWTFLFKSDGHSSSNPMDIPLQIRWKSLFKYDGHSSSNPMDIPQPIRWTSPVHPGENGFLAQTEHSMPFSHIRKRVL